MLENSLAMYALINPKGWIPKLLFAGFCIPSKYSHVLCRFLSGRSQVERKGASRRVQQEKESKEQGEDEGHHWAACWRVLFSLHCHLLSS